MSSDITALYAPSGTSGVSGVTPVAFRSLNATVAASATSPYSLSSIVQLSTWGRVLGAGVSLAASIQSLRTNLATATPRSVVAKAQYFVSTFTYTQNSLNSVPTSAGMAYSSTLINQFSKVMNAAASSVASAGTTNLASLQAIGITEQVLMPPGGTSAIATLAIDQPTLNAAATAHPAETLVLLTEATQPLLQEVSTFETLASSSNGLLTDLAILELTNLTQNLPAVSSPLTYLDVADALVNDNSKNILLGKAVNVAAEAPRTLITATDTSVTTDTATPVQVPTNNRQFSSAAVPTAEPQAAAMPSAEVAVSQNDAVLPAVTVTVNTNTTTQSMPVATRTLQNLVADPTLDAIDNNVLNPFYATVSSTYRQDAVTLQKLVAPTTVSPDIPVPVSAVDRVHGINGYKEMESGFGRR